MDMMLLREWMVSSVSGLSERSDSESGPLRNVRSICRMTAKND